MRDDATAASGWRPGTSFLADLSLAVLVLDREGRLLYANHTASTLLRIPADDDDARASWFEPPELEALEEVLGRVWSGQTWTGQLPLVTPSGATTPMTTLWSPVFDPAGAVCGAMVVVEPGGEPTPLGRALTTRLQRLAEVVRQLLLADTLEEVTKVVTDEMTDAAGATVTSLSLLVDEDTLALAALRGARPGAAARWATYPVSGNTPAAEAVRTGRVLVLNGREEILRRYPGLELAAEGERSMVCLPLRSSARPVGVMTMSFPGRRRHEPTELEFFGLLADACAQAVERIRAVEAAADREAKLRFLAEAAAELSSSLDYQATLGKVAELAVPWFADWCAIALEEDGVLHTLAVAHVDPAQVETAERLQRRYPPDPEAPRGSYQVLRTGRPELIPEVTDEVLTQVARDEEHLRLLRELHFHSALQVPLTVRDRTLGVITWVTGEGGRRFGRDDLAFGEDLARRAAVAIDNAMLHSELRDVAIRLQRAVLPDRLPDIPGWEIAVRYQPAGRTDAGGDFYDVVVLPDGRISVFVGDVMGRGVQAASAMAQLRAAVRTLVALDPEPDVVLAGLDRVFAYFDVDQLATMVCALVDPHHDQLRLVNAGHPAPLLVPGEGPARYLTTTDTLLLGAGGGTRATLTHPFRPGDLLLLYTDGLIERRGEDLDDGSRRLLRVAAALGAARLPARLDQLIDEVRPPDRDDDVATLAVRRQPG